MEYIKLIHGDSLQALKGYADNHFDWAIVDPPYGIGFDSEKIKSNGKTEFGWNRKLSGYTKKDWDKEIPPPEYFIELKRVSKNQIIWGGNYFGLVGGYIFWDKLIPQKFTLSCGELAYVSSQNSLKKFTYRWAGFLKGANGNVREERIHPTQKPRALYDWLLKTYTNENDLILDTHLGSGSIAIAAHYMKRKLIGYEIDKEYYDAACKRFKEQTMQQALW